MAKVADRYLKVDPYRIIEEGFHKEKNAVSESLFSLGNEYCGIRGFLEEGTSLPSLIGIYYNGIIEYATEDVPNAYRGIAKRSHFTINSPNFLKIHLSVDGKKLDLADAEISNFQRVLDMRDGSLERTFHWEIGSKKIDLCFRRILSMKHPSIAIQEIEIAPNEDIDLDLSFLLDGHPLHWGNQCYWNKERSWSQRNKQGMYLRTPTTNQSICVHMEIEGNKQPLQSKEEGSDLSLRIKETIHKGERRKFTRYVSSLASKKGDHLDSLLPQAEDSLKLAKSMGFAGIEKENADFFKEHYAKSDIIIDGDEADQQGIRYCQFQMIQAYHGLEEDNNIGAKGLTGEAYSGHAFWDSETYCLPYYLFNDQKAAKNLLLFRYHTLDQARDRAKDLDCEGACFPIATRDGKEACTLWQHASTQLQPTSGVAYAIFHYMNLYEDEEFMKRYGIEMLIEIIKFLYTRGQWNADHTHFGFYGVMGPDEFQVMVNHNTYTNYMGKKTFDLALSYIKDPKYANPALLEKYGMSESLIQEIEEASKAMLILYDPKTKRFEQHAGYYDLPHIDVDKIPTEEFPLYSHWSYDRIYRNDMLKQPDVLMFLFLYNQDFDDEIVKANYEFYEPRCIHESSLSPSIHSILASQIGKDEEASSFFGFATRLDLDDYNRNTREGLHMTSIAAAWMNIVYGFLGLRSEKGILKIRPTLPKRWTHYGVKITYRGSPLRFDVYPKELFIENEGKNPVSLSICGKEIKVEGKIKLPL